MMLTVKLTKSSSIDPQDTGLEPAVNPPCWASRTAVGLNLTIPNRHDGNDFRGHASSKSVGKTFSGCGSQTRSSLYSPSPNKLRVAQCRRRGRSCGSKHIIVGLALCITAACGDGNSSPTAPTPTTPTPPPAPQIVQVAGVWGYTVTLTGVTGGGCLGAALIPLIGTTSTGTMQVTQQGSSLEGHRYTRFRWNSYSLHWDRRKFINCFKRGLLGCWEHYWIILPLRRRPRYPLGVRRHQRHR